MPQNPSNPSRPDDPGRKLPWPEGTDPARLGERFEHGPAPEQRDLGNSFQQSNEADQRELGREFGDPGFSDYRKLANSFADPNSADDARLGRNFEETESSRPKPPLKDRVHMPHAPRDPRSRRIFWRVLIVAGVLFAVALLAGWLPRHIRNSHIDKEADDRKDSKPMVETAKVTRSRTNEGLVVPGTTLPLTEAYVYARANGYLKTRLVDIGDHVRKNQLLAIIDAPDLDQQVDQAREQLRQAQQQLEQQKSQLALATVTVQRYRVLVAKGVFSRQDGDTQETQYSSQQSLVAAAQRNVEAYEANLRRVEALQSYEYVRAPFDGVVTQRNVDVGALISASGTTSGNTSAAAPMGQVSSTGGTAEAGAANTGGTSGSNSTAATTAQSPGQGGPLFGIAQNQRLRILVSVPEGYLSAIHVGVPAQLNFQEFPSQPFAGNVTRTANSVDPNTRTMLTEVQVDNHEGKLVPGMYVVTTFQAPPGAEGPLLISGDAITIRHDKSMVAKITKGKVQFVPILIGRDYGSAVEVQGGLHEGDMYATSITDELQDGIQVQTSREPSLEEQPLAPPPQSTPPGGSTQYGNPGITDRNLQGQQSHQSQKTGGGSGERAQPSQGGGQQGKQSSTKSPNQGSGVKQ